MADECAHRGQSPRGVVSAIGENAADWTTRRGGAHDRPSASLWVLPGGALVAGLALCPDSASYHSRTGRDYAHL